MKLTRKSYKRKIVTFGVMLVLAISLISTGFAAWIISQGTEKETGGNVEVGVVTDKSVEIVDLNFYADCYNPGQSVFEKQTPVAFENLGTKPLRFSFDPVYGDKDGFVKFDEEAFKDQAVGEQTGFEALRFKVKGKIKNAKMLKDVTLDLGVTKAILDAAAANYIVLPDYAFETGKAEKHTYTLTTELDRTNETIDDTATFEFVVEIKWGTKFNSKNPSEYFDSEDFTDPVGAGKDYNKVDEIKIALEELKGIIYGLESNGTKAFGDRSYKTYAPEVLDGGVAPQFKFTITANAK